ncbi:hypothetical protein ACH8E3_03330 [Paenibacillus sp. CMAA1364]
MVEIWLMNRAGNRVNRQRVPINKMEAALKHTQDRMDVEDHSGIVVQIFKGKKFVSGFNIYDLDYLKHLRG